MEKVLIACCGAFLSETDMIKVLTGNEVFDPGVVKTVLSGSNYIRGKRGMMLITEDLQKLQFQAFFAFLTLDLPDGTNEVFKKFQKFVDCKDDHRTWRYFQEMLNKFLGSFNYFIQKRCSENNQFKFWNTFLNDIVPVLVDLNRCFR